MSEKSAELIPGESLLPETAPCPPWWLPGGHAQTLWRRFAPVPAVSQRRQRVELADGDFIDLDHVAAEPRAAGDDPGRRPLVFLLHGLCGCSRSPYILSLQDMLRRHGHDSVAMNLRGCSGEPNRLARAYHSGATEDVEEVIARLLQQENGRPLAMVGYSLGANMLVKWLAETPLSGHVRSAVSVSNPFDLLKCSREMVKGRLSRFYGDYFLYRLVLDLERKKHAFRRPGWTRELAVLEALGDTDPLRDIWDFDERITAPLHGFADAADYYRQCSSARFLAGVTVPLLVIHACNDPIIPVSSLPPETAAPDNIRWAISPGGGHVGFAARGCLDWLERRILQSIEQAG